MALNPEKLAQAYDHAIASYTASSLAVNLMADGVPVNFRISLSEIGITVMTAKTLRRLEAFGRPLGMTIGYLPELRQIAASIDLSHAYPLITLKKES